MRCLCRNLLKGDKNHLLIQPEVRGPVQIVAQCSDRTEGPVRLKGSIQSWGQGCYNPWGHTVWTLFGQLILGRESWVMGTGTPLTSRIGV